MCNENSSTFFFLALVSYFYHTTTRIISSCDLLLLLVHEAIKLFTNACFIIIIIIIIIIILIFQFFSPFFNILKILREIGRRSSEISPLVQLTKAHSSLSLSQGVSPKREELSLKTILSDHLAVLNKKSLESSQKSELEAIQCILNHYSFPPAHWDLCLDFYVRYITLKQTVGTTRKKSLWHISLNCHAYQEIIFHLTQQKNVPNSWVSSLQLYRALLLKSWNSEKKGLMSTRHHVLTTMLNNQRWIEALQMYYHIMHQKEFCRPSTTGFLVWRLGQTGRWTDVLRIYSISSRYLARAIVKLPVNEVRQQQRKWGTVISMMMDALSQHRKEYVEHIVNDIISHKDKLELRSFVLLDGNFIRAVERLDISMRDKLLELANKHSLLDHYRVIRGLISQKRWLDALHTFCSVMKRSYGHHECISISKREIGQTRLGLLHAANDLNVERVAKSINSVRDYGSCLLNDAEIECIFSKALQGKNKSFWMYCLILFDSMFVHQKTRSPSSEMVSLMLRNKSLPWIEGLRVFSVFLRAGKDGSNNFQSQSKPRAMNVSIVLDALSQLLYRQNAREAADNLIQRFSNAKISVPAAFLLFSSEEALQRVILTGCMVHPSVWHHILHEHRSDDDKIPRPLLCLSLYMQARCGQGFLENKKSFNNGFQWLVEVPSSVHVEVIRCIERSKICTSLKADLLKRYLLVLACPSSTELPPDDSRNSLYCATYEVIVVFANTMLKYAKSVDNDYELFLREILELVIVRYSCLPPFFMFLPNQLDRLAPRNENWARSSEARLRSHCSVCVCLITSIVTKKASFHLYRLAEINPVIHGLLILCLRTCEMATFKKQPKLPPWATNQQTCLAEQALKIVLWESELKTYASPSSLFLFFKIVRHTSQRGDLWKEALKCASVTLSETLAPPLNDDRDNRKTSGERMSSAHYKLFQQAFGWEIGLAVWYRYFPHDVLKNVAKNNKAIDYCLSLPLLTSPTHPKNNINLNSLIKLTVTDCYVSHTSTSFLLSFGDLYQEMRNRLTVSVENHHIEAYRLYHSLTMTQTSLPPEVEDVLGLVHQPQDQFDAPGFVVENYINSHFSDRSMLHSFDAFFIETKDQLNQKKHSLFAAVYAETHNSVSSDDRVTKIKDTVSVLRNRVGEIRGRASASEETVQELSSHIRELDIAKSHLTSSINTLRSIELWMLQLQIMFASFNSRKYVQARDALQEALRYQTYFSSIVAMPRVKDLNDWQEQQCSEMEYYIRNSVFGEVNWEVIDEKELAEVCALADLLDESSRNKIRDRFIEKALDTYNTRFKRGTEDAKLERTERRYVYIRTLLEHFESMFKNVFPRRWCVPQELCVSFCLRTKEELDYQLRESSGKIDVVILTYVIQKTIDIEKDLTQMMAWKEDFTGRDSLPLYRYNGLVLSAFKEHMHLFVQNEDQLMKAALDAHPLMGEGESAASGWNTGEDECVRAGTVLPLAEDMFIFISQSLKRSLRISQSDVLLEMSGVWRKYLLMLSQEMRDALPNPSVTKVDVRRTCLIVNTARFCQTTSQDLGREIVVRSEASPKDVAFEKVIEDFADLYSKGVHSLVEGLGVAIAPLLSGYGSGSFLIKKESASGAPAHDESQTIRGLSSIIHDLFLQCAAVLPNPVLRFSVEKMVAQVIPSYVGCLYSMRKMTEEAINIMRIDAASLERTLLQLPNYNDPARFSPTDLTSFVKLVRREFGHLHRALKVLQVCSTIDVFLEVYYEVMLPEDRSIQNFVRLAELRDVRREELRVWIGKLSSRGVVEATKRDLDREAARGLATGACSHFRTLEHKVQNPYRLRTEVGYTIISKLLLHPSHNTAAREWHTTMTKADPLCREGPLNQNGAKKNTVCPTSELSEAEIVIGMPFILTELQLFRGGNCQPQRTAQLLRFAKTLILSLPSPPFSLYLSLILLQTLCKHDFWQTTLEIRVLPFIFRATLFFFSMVKYQLLLCALFVALLAPLGTAEIFFHETFDSLDNWVQSKHRSDYGRVALSSGSIVGDPVTQKGLKLTEDNRHYAVSRKLPVPIDTVGRNYVISYSIKNEQELSCGGTYLKFFSGDFDPTDLSSDTPYLFMFGTDRCGEKNRLHMIRNYKGEYVEWIHADRSIGGPLTHFYTVAFNTDNTYALYVDGVYRWKQDIERDWHMLPEPTLPDPEDIKPKDWVESGTMPNPDAKKPADWDESQPSRIPDPNAKQPADWDEAEQGRWTPPTIPNPLYRGKWHPPHIRNPAYKGPWIQKRIPNPEYTPDPTLYELGAPIEYVGIEVWQVEGGSIFDDIMIGDDLNEIVAYIDNFMKTNGAKEKEVLREREEEKKRLEERHKADIESASIVQQSMTKCGTSLLFIIPLTPMLPCLFPNSVFDLL
eukprot:gene9704-6800_t